MRFKGSVIFLTEKINKQHRWIQNSEIFILRCKKLSFLTAQLYTWIIFFDEIAEVYFIFLSSVQFNCFASWNNIYVFCIPLFIFSV